MNMHLSLIKWILLAIPLILLAACASSKSDEGERKTYPLGAGFRHSTYGPAFDPGPAYWLQVGGQMRSKFKGSHAETIWIVGELAGQGTRLSFPGTNNDPLIQHTAQNLNEAAFMLFDEHRVNVWLQVESGYADVVAIFNEVLKKYSHHSCVIGVGVDVEWYKSTDPDEGHNVSDEEAARWLALARSYNPEYRLFLKHWLPEKMPPTLREGLFFIDDGQQFTSLDQMVEDFGRWAEAFDPFPVGFQYGYPADRKWWGTFNDPLKEIGNVLLKNYTNTAGLYWVDFTILDVFKPPE
jgi:hypothetical protein